MGASRLVDLMLLKQHHCVGRSCTPKGSSHIVCLSKCNIAFFNAVQVFPTKIMAATIYSHQKLPQGSRTIEYPI